MGGGGGAGATHPLVGAGALLEGGAAHTDACAFEDLLGAACRRHRNDGYCVCRSRQVGSSLSRDARCGGVANGWWSRDEDNARKPQPRAVWGLLLLVVLALAKGVSGQVTITTAEMQQIRQSHCRNGTLSMTAVCNTTWLSYPTGCQSDEAAHHCAGPTRGLRCREIPSVNMTCLTPIRCGALDVPPNSALAVSTPQALETVAVVCNPGYEYFSTVHRMSKGFSGEVDCLETGNYSDIRPIDFSCQPVDCGIFCRSCADEESTVRLSTTGSSTYQGVGFDEWEYQDRFGPCCMARSNPDDDFLQAERLETRLGALKIKLAAGSPTQVLFPDSVHLECLSAAYGNVPGSGYASPRCIPRPECVFNPHTNSWSPAACVYVRGMYQPGMTCNVPALVPTIEQYETPRGIAECAASAPECEFPISVGVRLTSAESDPNKMIIWTYASESPVTIATEMRESTPQSGALTWTGQDIAIASSKEGCNVFNQFKQIRAIVVVPGKPNSPLLTSPLLKVTATTGEMPNATRVPVCPDVMGRPKSEANVHYWCEADPERLTTKVQCGADDWKAKPPLKVSACPAYRYCRFLQECAHLVLALRSQRGRARPGCVTAGGAWLLCECEALAGSEGALLYLRYGCARGRRCADSTFDCAVVFEPTALAASDTDAYALSELR